MQGGANEELANQRAMQASSLYLQGVNARQPCLLVLVLNDDKRPAILIKRKCP